MKTLIVVVLLLAVASGAVAEEMVTIPVSALEAIRAYILELQAAYDALVEELNVKDVALDSAHQELSRLRKRSSGVWLGASAGVPFPTASGQVMYVFNNSIGVMVNGGYATKPYAQAGVMVRVGK